MLNKKLAAAILSSLGALDNFTLAVANSGLTGFGKVSGRALKPFYALSLCEKDGAVSSGKEELLAALDAEINRRIENGTWSE